MAVANKKTTVAAVLLAFAATAGCRGKGGQMTGQNGDREKAAALVRSYGRHLGAATLELDAEDDRSFGETGFHYDGARRVLTGRVFIMKLDSDLMKAELVERAKQAMAELNGPKITPLFERAGGRFEFDTAKDILFLKKDLPVQTTTERQLREQMDELSDVGAKWVFRWLGWAIQIIYGDTQPPHPPLPVTRANDAQHTEFER
jgi:hypothetical protein